MSQVAKFVYSAIGSRYVRVRVQIKSHLMCNCMKFLREEDHNFFFLCGTNCLNIYSLLSFYFGPCLICTASKCSCMVQHLVISLCHSRNRNRFPRLDVTTLLQRQTRSRSRINMAVHHRYCTKCNEN